MNIQFSPPDIREEEIENVVEVLKSGWITTGPKTKEFEKKIADYCGTEKAICLNSATAGLEMVLRALGVGKGDEVITTAYTYTASASVIEHVGAKIILVDTGVNSFHIDYSALEEAITENTKVIIPVDIGGVMCDYDRIFESIERKKSLFKPRNEIQEKFGRCIVLADGAHSFGAEYKNRKSGNVADFTSFSFHAVKNLTTAEGGAVTWTKKENIDNEYIYKYINNLSLHGQTKDALSKNKMGSWEYDIVSTGYKCNMTDIMAAIGLAQLSRYDELINRRKEIIDKYDKGLSKNKQVSFLEHINSSGHLYLIRIEGIDENRRNDLIKSMAERGIATNVHYKPLPLLTAYKELGFDIVNYPNAFNMYKNEITLPLHTRLTDREIEYIIDNLLQIL